MTDKTEKSIKDQVFEIAGEIKDELVKAWQQEPFMFILYAIVVLIIVGAVLVGICEPGFEAATFNKLTGGHANYWDAIWVNLRVDCSNVIQ